MIHGYLVHSYVHNRAVARLVASTIKVWLSNLRCTSTATSHANYAATMLLLYFFTRLEDRRQQTLVVHKRAIVMILSNVTDWAGLATRQLVFEITVERMVLTVINFEICKIAAVLGCERALLHIDKMVLFLLL